MFWKAPEIGLNRAFSEIDHYGIKIDKFLFNQFDRDSFKIQAKKLVAAEPDGILIAPVYFEEALETIKCCEDKRIPFVFVNSTLEIEQNLSFIGQDSKQSGYLAAKLISYGMPPDAEFLIINISRALNNHKHILSRQQGFEEYCCDKGIHHLSVTNIDDKNDQVVDEILQDIFNKNKAIKGIFVTNSKVFKIARFLEKNKTPDIRLVGYDLIDNNIHFLDEGIIDFLISQRPVEQGYYGIMTLFNHVILGKEVKKIQHLPIDIITKENYQYYIGS